MAANDHLESFASEPVGGEVVMVRRRSKRGEPAQARAGAHLLPAHDDPHAARAAALGLGYDPATRKGNYPGTLSTAPLAISGLEESVARTIGVPVVPQPGTSHGHCRLTLKGGLREILAASYLEALGVNTSKAFSLIETGEQLSRNDEPSPTRSAVMVRLQHSHIRFGTFQRCAWLEDRESLRRVRLNARQHASRQGWAAIVELFEQYLRSAMQPQAVLKAVHPDA